MPDQEPGTASQRVLPTGKTSFQVFSALLTSLSLHLVLLIALAAITFVLPGSVQELSLLYEELELPRKLSRCRRSSARPPNRWTTTAR